MRSGFSAGKATSAPASGGGGGSAPADGPYFASTEVPRADSVLTADFRGGIWYSKTADQNSANGTPWPGGGADGLGWGGTIFADPTTPTNGTINLQAIGKKPLFTRSNYVATTGVITHSDNQRNNAWHNLFGAGSGGYTELYIRYYTLCVPANYYGAGNPSASYVYGGQKHITGNRWLDDAGIYWYGYGYNVGQGSPGSGGTAMATNNHSTNDIIHQNQSNDIDEVAGNWYYKEHHVKLNTPGNSDGIFEAWINNGGPTGDFSSQAPTLRIHRTDIDYGNTVGETQKLGVVWLENWSSNDQGGIGSAGEQFWANLHVATAAPLGFAA